MLHSQALCYYLNIKTQLAEYHVKYPPNTKTLLTSKCTHVSYEATVCEYLAGLKINVMLDVETCNSNNTTEIQKVGKDQACYPYCIHPYLEIYRPKLNQNLAG